MNRPSQDSSTFAANFARLLRDYPGALADRKRFIGLLKDFFPTRKKEVNLLSSLYDMKVAADIEAAAAIDRIFARRFEKRLRDEYGTVAHDARRAVALWCKCYGKEILGKPCNISNALSRAKPKPPAQPASAESKDKKEPSRAVSRRQSPVSTTFQRALDKELLSKAESANMNEISRLIQNGANVNAVDEAGFTPLQRAALYNNPEVLQLLINNGADMNAVDSRGGTLLMRAALHNYPAVLKLLLNKGADVNAADQHGETPLMYAARCNYKPEVLRLLLDSGADVALKDKLGKTALDYANENKYLKGTDVYARLERPSAESEGRKL